MEPIKEETKAVEKVEDEKQVRTVKLTDTLHTANEVKEVIGVVAQDAKSGNLHVGNVSRLIALILVWANQLMLLYGGTNYTNLIPEVSESTIYLISVILTMVVSIYCYWKAHGQGSKTSEIVFNAMKNTDISLDEVAGAIDNIVDEHCKTKTKNGTKTEMEQTDNNSEKVNNDTDDLKGETSNEIVEKIE